jgi:hypothetical protein
VEDAEGQEPDAQSTGEGSKNDVQDLGTKAGGDGGDQPDEPTEDEDRSDQDDSDEDSDRQDSGKDSDEHEVEKIEPKPGVTAPLDYITEEEKSKEPVGVMPGAGPDEPDKDEGRPPDQERSEDDDRDSSSG